MDNSTSQSFASTYSNIATKTIFSNINIDADDELEKLMKTISENNDPSIFIILNKNSTSNKFDEIILYDPFYTPKKNESYKNRLSIFKAYTET